jgi:hypothetical protein
MYLLLITSFTAIFISCYILTKLFFNNRGSALLIIISTLLYFLPTMAGALGILRPYALITFALITLLATVYTYLYLSRSYDKRNEFKYIEIKYCARPVRLEILFVVIPAICSLLWISIFAVQSINHKIAAYYIPPYPWDVVEYHFPHLVEAMQSGSLWTTIWAHYPMGCEMFHSWGFVFLRNDALVYPTHFFFSIIFIFFSGFVLHILCFRDEKALSGTEIIAYLIMTVSLLLFPPLFDMQFNQIGKNDIAMSAFIMAALCFLLQCITETSKSETFEQNILLLGMALGIASGIKPPGVLYAGFFLVILLKDSFSKKISLYPIFVVSLGILLLAVFWYIRPFIMLGGIPPDGAEQSIVYNLYKGLDLLLKGRENILFSLSMVFCLIMWVVWHNKDVRMRVANYTLAASIVILCITPYGAFNKTSIQLRLAPATIPLVIIISLATFLRLIVKVREEYKTYALQEPISWSYRRKAVLAGLLFGLSSVAMIAVSFLGPLKSKPLWAWSFRGLIIICFLAASLYIYNSLKAIKDYTLSMSRYLLYVMTFIIVVIALVFQIIHYKPSGDLPGYNEDTSVYRWVYANIRGKTICVLGLRAHGLYGKEFTNRVFYGGYSDGTTLENWLSMINREKPDYLIIGRDYAQHEGWYDYRPFPRDVGKIPTMPEIFHLVFSDNHAMIFRIEPSFYSPSSRMR